ncbi:hypothetical protein [Paraferrimonas sp. SM1919]|uniref:hypothetical protein n=1 Tax=Paraferrimonas sp. SM1919 TaxID=2662263 RepID=UPI0013D6AA5F|nr:hypothetical protein [Paraferrimonas sp. SM1919]
MSLANVLKEAWTFFRTEFWGLLGVAYPLLVAQSAVQLWLGNEMAGFDASNPEQLQITTEHYLGVMGLLLIAMLMYASVTLFIMARSNERKVQPLQVWFAALPYVPALLAATVFSGVFVLLSALPMMLTQFLPLIFVPIWIGVRLFYVNFMIIDGATPLKAINYSFKFSAPVQWPTLAVMSLLFPIAVFSADIIQSLGELPAVAMILLNALSGFIALFVTIALYRIYMVTPKPKEA